ncbi:hypothetical protein ACSBR2_025404 [Camellia fascicularis]
MIKSSQQNPIASATQRSPLPLTTVRLGSPAASAEPSKSKSSKSKPKAKPKSKASNEKLIQIAKLLFSQDKSQDEDNASNGSTSSEASTSHGPYGPQFQDAQDPYTYFSHWILCIYIYKLQSLLLL